MTEEKKSNKRQPTTKTKKSTTSKETTKNTSKKTNTTISSPADHEQTIREVNELIAQAKDVYINASNTVDLQIGRIEKALETIRKAYNKENINVPEILNKYTNDINKFRQLQSRMKRHIERIEDESIPIEQRVMIISSMIELSKNIPEVEISENKGITNDAIN